MANQLTQANVVKVQRAIIYTDEDGVTVSTSATLVSLFTASTDILNSAKNLVITPPKGDVVQIDLVGETTSALGNTRTFQNYLLEEKPFAPAKLAGTILFDTIETNFDYGLSLAPSPLHRFQAMKELAYPHKFISMEPLMEFHLRTVVDWMKEIDPEIIEIGADNYHNHLPEPKSNGALTQWKVRWLLDGLREFCPTVVEKGGLERLKQEVIPISCGTFNR